MALPDILWSVSAIHIITEKKGLWSSSVIHFYPEETFDHSRQVLSARMKKVYIQKCTSITIIYLTVREKDCVLFREKDCVLFREKDCVLFREKDCVLFREKDCIIQREGLCIIQREGLCIIQREGLCIIQREGLCIIHKCVLYATYTVKWKRNYFSNKLFNTSTIIS
jgi:hypothetical protein